MSPGLLLALAVGLADPAALDAARAALARGENGAAEALALAAAEPPQRGAALYLAGLARFRDGRPEEALAALDEAGAAEDPPARGPWLFNRGACRYALGRNAEAEADFVEAAALSPELAATALVNAGFAALDRGDAARARALADQARPLASGPAAELVSDLERQLRTPEAAEAAREHQAGLEAWDAGRLEEARARFQRAAALDPEAAQSRIMAAAAAYRLGERSVARAELDRTLAGPLSPADATLARAYRDAATPGLAGRGLGWDVSARVGAGRDDNVLQSGLSAPREVTGASSEQVASPYLVAGGRLSGRTRPAGGWTLEGSWWSEQLAYTASAAEDYSLQQHQATVSVERADGRLRLGLAGDARVAFTGLSDFRPLELAAGLGGWLAFDWSDRATTRLDAAWEPAQGQGSEFAYLSGERLELSLGQGLRLGPVTLGAAARLRSERLGTQRQQTAGPLPPGTCTSMMGCSQAQVIPSAYDAAVLAGSAQWSPLPPLSLELAAGWEARRYREESWLEVDDPMGGTTRLDVRRRHDDRLWGGLALRWSLGAHLSLALRLDVLSSRSNEARDPSASGAACDPGGAPCHALDADDRNYVKRWGGLELGGAW